MTFRVLFVGLATIVLTAFVASADEPVTTKQSRSLVSAQVHYASGILITSNNAGTAAIQFTARHDDGSWGYEFRYRPNVPAAKEQVGTGTVSPVAPKPADRQTTKTGMSGEDSDDIVAGDLAVLWGKGSKDWGWVYYLPEEMTVQVVFINFKEMDLARFQK